MAYSTVNSAVAKVVMDAKLKVVDDLVVYLSTKIDLDEDFQTWFTEFKGQIKETDSKAIKEVGKKSKKSSSSDSSDSEKKKRQPSAFNLYVKDMSAIMKEENPDMEKKSAFEKASKSWKEHPMALFIKAKVEEFRKEDKEALMEELYAKAKALYSGKPEDKPEEELEEENEVVEHEPEAMEEDKPKAKPKAKKESAKKSNK